MSIQCYSLFECGKKGEVSTVLEANQYKDHIKKGRVHLVEHLIGKCMEDSDDLRKFFGNDSTLVPAPKSAPLVKNAIWPPNEISKKLIALGLGREIIPILHRTKSVPKSAFQSGAEERPTKKLHCETIACQTPNDSVFPIDKVIIVDDVLTQGRTTYACYEKILERYPNSEIKVFTLIRWNSFTNMTQFVSPTYGEIICHQSGSTQVNYN